MPIMTKAATPFKIPKAAIPNTLWYKITASGKQRRILAIPKKVNHSEKDVRINMKIKMAAKLNEASFTSFQNTWFTS